jgi:glycosyltransferase involved in cell wall biosynthesis
MHVVVLGTRGIPEILGGVETHCQELYPRMLSKEVSVTVITRTPYVKDQNNKKYRGVTLRHIYAPKIKSLEAIVHTFLGVLYASLKRPDVLHIHAVGPMLMTPLARILGLKVIVTHHGPDYNRQKWGGLAKKILKLGEKMGVRFANKIIVISDVIKKIVEDKYQRYDSNLIYNGVNIPTKSTRTDYIESLGLSTKKYMIAVGRFVEEKGFHDLIKAYEKVDTEVKLVLVGDADHETNYSQKLKQEAMEKGVILTGFIRGEKLNQIFSHARLFLMPSYHEGLPIALLEAMSYNLPVLVSDIPANNEVGLKVSDYFATGDIIDLETKLNEKLKQIETVDYKNILQKEYNWETIALETIKVYYDR